MTYRVIVLDKNIILFLERRKYFVKKYYKSVVLRPNTRLELDEIDRIILINNYKFDIYPDDVPKEKMSYEFSLNFCIQDSNITRFKKYVSRFISKFAKLHENEWFSIINWSFETNSNMVNKMFLNIQSFETVEVSKSWFDYNYYYPISNHLKKYNIKKKKNVVKK